MLQNIASVVIALSTASGYLYLGSLTVWFHSMRHIVLSIHPHIVEGSRSHDPDSDMIFDLQLGWQGRGSNPLPFASENKPLAMTTPFPGGGWSSMKGRLLYPYTPAETRT